MTGRLLWIVLAISQVAALPRQLDIGLYPPVPVQGQALLIEVHGARPQDTVRGELFGRNLRFYLDRVGRLRALTAVGHDQAPGPSSIAIHLTRPDGHTVIYNWPLQVRARTFGEQRLTVRQRFVHPPTDEQERIQRERDELKAIRSRKPTARKWLDSFIWPRKGRITSAFGLKRVYNGQLERVHLGLDINGHLGAPVLAVNTGQVILTGERYISGGTVIIDHGLGIHSLCYHLSELAVKPGDLVTKGQRIGAVGRSGRVTGPHLHLAIEIDGVAIDPASLIDLDLSETNLSAPNDESP